MDVQEVPLVRLPLSMVCLCWSFVQYSVAYGLRGRPPSNTPSPHGHGCHETRHVPRAPCNTACTSSSWFEHVFGASARTSPSTILRHRPPVTRS